MNTYRGFAGLTVLLIALGTIVIGGGTYVALNPEVMKISTEEQATTTGDGTETERKGSDKWIEIDSAQIGTAKASISWKFTDMDFDAANTPHTEVTAIVNGKEYVVGTFEGSCSEVGASGGVDGKGLLAGEVSAAQCWFAGGGDEIGVFAHEDGGYQIMVGSLSEPDGEGATGFRGDFKIKTDISL